MEKYIVYWMITMLTTTHLQIDIDKFGFENRVYVQDEVKKEMCQEFDNLNEATVFYSEVKKKQELLNITGRFSFINNTFDSIDYSSNGTIDTVYIKIK